MLRISSLLYRQFSGNLALAAITFSLAAVAQSQLRAAEESSPVGRIDFQSLKLPEATVEVDLNQDMFRDLFGIGDAAISGVAETLLQSAGGGENAKTTKMAAEQLEAARQIVQLAGNVVREVRVRVYEHFSQEGGDAQQLFTAVGNQLQASNWETLVRVHDNDNLVRVAAIRSDNAVKGILVVVNDHENVVLANVVCDVSPENVKKFTAAATKIGLENGLAEQLAQKMKHLPGGKPRFAPERSKNEERGRKKESSEPPAPPKRPAPPVEQN